MKIKMSNLDIATALYVILWGVLGITFMAYGKFLEGIASFILVNQIRR
jgi:hypothetical protein